jgi:hypothetical protein
MAKLMTKFQKNLQASHKEIRGKRADFLNEEAEVSMRRRVDVEKDELRGLRREEMGLEDMHPDSTTTLKVTKEGFDSGYWATQLIEVKTAIKLQEQKLKIAEDTYSEYFQ